MQNQRLGSDNRVELDARVLGRGFSFFGLCGVSSLGLGVFSFDLLALLHLLASSRGTGEASC